MSISFYIASSLSRAGLVQDLAKALIGRGLKQTYDWAKYGTAGTPDSRAKEVSVREIESVVASDYVLMIAAPGKAARGTHCELGAACATGKKVLLFAERAEDLLADGYPCVFHSHPCVRKFFVAGMTAELLARVAFRIIDMDLIHEDLG